jgi:DNA-binding transcriptional ArsR family regulator
MKQLITPDSSSAADPDIQENSDACPEETEQSSTRDKIFGLLSNRRRRFVLYYLRDHDGPVSVRELAAEIAAWENGVGQQEVTYKQRKRVYTALYQSHLQKMSEAGIIEYEPNRGIVALTTTGEKLDAYLEVVDEHDIPWSDYFLGLSILASVFMLAVVTSIPPFVSLSGGIAGVVICTVFFASALVHMVQTRQSRIIG